MIALVWFIKIIMILAKKIVISLIIFFIIREAYCDGFSSRKKDKTVVESDHFFSEQKLEQIRKLSNVESQKPLVLILKKKISSKYKISQNPLSILFKMGNQSHTCTMNNDQSLCVVDEVTSTNIQMTLKCAKTPCEASWIIYQPQINKKLEGQLGQGLFSLQQSSDHLVAFISCNNPENQHFSDDVEVYSESHYERKSQGNLLYFLFANQENGYFYIDVKERSQECTHISIANVPKIVEYSSKQVRDFTSKQSPSIIGLSMPTKDFRFDCYLYKQQQSHFTGPTLVALKGINENISEILSQYSIFGNSSSSYIDFSITFKKPSKNFTKLSLQIQGDNDKMTILNFVIDQSDSQQVDIEQKNYFYLEKGASINYKLLPDDAQQQTVYIIFGDNSSISSNQSNCSAKIGCEFSITALANVSSYVYLSLSEVQRVSPYIPLQKTIRRKIKQGRSLHFSKPTKAKSSFQIVVNNPNVIMYASSKRKCPYPSYQCNDRKGNHLHPIQYQSKVDDQLILTVQGLQNGQFVLTVIQEQDEYIHLQDGHAFSYIIEQDEDQILFKYTLSYKKDVSFNLVAPINHLTLEVSNSKFYDQNVERVISTQGYVTYIKEQINELNFILSIKKTEVSLNKQTHFTILASSTGTVVRLEQSISHYQNILPNATRQYIFQYNPKQQCILNFYTHNIKDQQINIMLAVTKDRIWNENNLDQLWIDRQSDHLDLSMISKHICELQGQENCQIFLLLKNQMSIEVDITITLMMRNSIIELKDGIWQSYLQSTIASQAYFYFHPKHVDNDIVIIYSTIAEDLRLSYTLWKSDSKSIDPSEWPFPERSQLEKQTDISSINHVSIGKETFKEQCWPDCVVLITLYRDKQTDFKVLEGYTDFKIMVSNSQIQLPQKTRINLVLKKEEEKEVLIDLKYILEKQMITIFTSYSIGSFQITANVISSTNQRCPEQTETADFLIEMGETIIQMNEIKQKIASMNMTNDENIFLCISTKGYQHGKLSIQYSSDKNSIQLLHMNSFQQINIQPNQSKIYKVQGFYDYSAKIIRKRGFPFIFSKSCERKDLKKCEQQFMEQTQRGKQILNKLQQLNQQPCNQCVNLYKFTTIEPSTFNLHINSRFSETELKQHQLITDFVAKEEEGRYVITHIRRQDLSVNIHVIEGDIQVTFTDYKRVNLFKTTEKGKNIIQFSIPPSQIDLTSLKESAFFGQFQFSDTFVAFHINLKSKQGTGSATYSITYSSGENQLFLHDGLVTDIVLEPQTPIKFHYENEVNKNHIYLTLSGSDESLLSLLDIKSYYIQSEGEGETKVEFPLTVPTMRKKTINPTLLFSLPQQHYFQVVLKNPINKPYVISISINHQQLIMLPFNHQYPFTLHAQQDINFAVEASQIGYAQVHIRKCDKSQPSFSYAFDYNDFSAGQFQNEQFLTDQSQYKTYIKLSKAGTFYLRFQAEEQPSLLSVNLIYYSQKPNHGFIKAGNRGFIQHELVESKTAEVAFVPVKCENSPCENIKYYSLASQNLQDLYAQLVCPSNYFSIQQRHSQEVIQAKQIAYDPSTPTIHFYSPLKNGKTSYIAVKAVTQTGEQIYYKPIQVVTIWGHLSKTSKTYKISIGFIILFSICGLLCFVKYSARRGYKKLDEDPQQSRQMRQIKM